MLLISFAAAVVIGSAAFDAGIQHGLADDTDAHAPERAGRAGLCAWRA